MIPFTEFRRGRTEGTYQTDVPCPKCGEEDYAVKWIANPTEHLALWCACCGNLQEMETKDKEGK